MFWIRSGLHSLSISDWLTAGPAIVDEPSNDIEGAREAMLDALGDAGGRRRETLLRRISHASDIHVLWALRPDVMEAVSHMHGESEGRRRLALATEKFAGLVPAAALTKPGRRHRIASATA
jgi:hypothetical protein